MPNESSLTGGLHQESLASRLVQGPLPLALALRCATDVAATLRELHEVGRTHGEVSLSSIVLRPSGAALLPSKCLMSEANPRVDVAAFGTVLYQMLTGSKPLRGDSIAPPERRAPHAGPTGLRAAATRLAIQCFATPPDHTPTMQMVVTEVRLLSLLAKQSGGESTAAPQDAPAPPARPKTDPLAEWGAAAEPVEKPARAERAESFLHGKPTKEFVSAMLLRKPVPSAAPDQPEVEPIEIDEEHDTDPKKEEGAGERPASPIEICPKCGSRQVHESHARTKLEFLISAVGIPVYRCHRCCHRFVVVFKFALSRPAL